MNQNIITIIVTTIIIIAFLTVLIYLIYKRLHPTHSDCLGGCSTCSFNSSCKKKKKEETQDKKD